MYKETEIIKDSKVIKIVLIILGIILVLTLSLIIFLLIISKGEVEGFSDTAEYDLNKSISGKFEGIIVYIF